MIGIIGLEPYVRFFTRKGSIKVVAKVKLTLIVSSIVAALLFPASAMAAIDAETIVAGKCTACHMLDRIRKATKTKTEWEEVIDTEINRGAQLTRGERRAVIDWLASNFGKTGLTQIGETPTEPQETKVAKAAKTEVAQTAEPAPPSQALPFNQQAQTGVELWQFLMSGGALVGGGALLRRKR